MGDERSENTGPDTAERVEDISDNREAAVRLAQKARRSLAIFTRDLEPEILDNHEFLEAVKRLALGGRYVKVRILIVDSTRAVKEGHRLVELARRLSSLVELRKPSTDFLDRPEAYVIADNSGILYRPIATRYEGIFGEHDPPRAREMLREFDRIWQQSHADTEMRRLGI